MGKNQNKPKTKHTHTKTNKRFFFCDTAICDCVSVQRFCDLYTTPHQKGVCTAKPRTNQTPNSKYTIEIWLILPVVICLFQGLSHACLRITALQESAHGSLHQTQSAAKMLRSPQNWIPWRNAKLIHESTRMSSTHAACSASRSEASCE